MTAITRERLLKIQSWRETYGPGSSIVMPAEEAEELARIALASMDAKPIGEVVEIGSVFIADFYGQVTRGDKLYTAPPAPVAMKYHQIRELVNDLRDIAIEYHGAQQLRERIARTVRAAMLQAGNSPVTPDGWVMVPKELTCEMDDAAWEAYHETRSMSDIWAALLAAAPQKK